MAPFTPRKKKEDTNHEFNYAEAFEDVKVGMSVYAAAKKHGVSRTTLRRRIAGGNNKVGGPTILSKEEEKVIKNTLDELAKWGFGFDSEELKRLIQNYLNNEGRKVADFKFNYPGKRWLENFKKRQKITKRPAGNIRKARAKLSYGEIEQFFKHLEKTGELVAENVCRKIWISLRKKLKKQKMKQKKL